MSDRFDSAMAYFNGDQLAADVFLNKYALRDRDGNLLEQTPDAMHRRLAREFARIEAGKFKEPYTEDFLFSVFQDFVEIIPQGSPMYGIGNPYQIASVSNCFVSDPPQDSYAGIFWTDEQFAQICKRRGGVGTDLSLLRPAGTPTANAGRTSSGVVTFMERLSNTIREVGQCGRRGAGMLTLSVHHPDVLVFAQAKVDLKKVTGANISVRLSNEFMQAVKAGTTYQQRWPVDAADPEIRKDADARSVWRELNQCAWKCAEPGLLFWDNILRESPADCYAHAGFRTVSTNPCCFSTRSIVWVTTKTGIKEIKDVRPGDEIWVDDVGVWASTSGYFKSGEASVYRVAFSNGDTLEVTANHKLMLARPRRVGTKIVHGAGDLVQVDSLKVGDKIILHRNPVSEGCGFGQYGTRDEGYVLGWVTGDGCLSFHSEKEAYPDAVLDFWAHEHDAGEYILGRMRAMGYDLSLGSCGSTGKRRIRSNVFTRDFTNCYEVNIWKFKSETARIDFLFGASREFVQGFLAAYFSADGTVGCGHINKNYNIQLSSINRERLIQIRQLLLLFGVRSGFSLMREAGEAEFKNGGRFQTKDCWRLTITGRDNLRRFSDQIGFITGSKQTKLDESLAALENGRESKCSDYTTIRSIEPAGITEVGCIAVDGYHRFAANTVMSGNSELPLSVLDSCRLLLLNLFGFVRNPFRHNATFDFDHFRSRAYVAQRLMDDLVDLELEAVGRIIQKVQSDPEPEEVKCRELVMWQRIEQACRNGRRTGTGGTALGDLIAATGLRYGSDESIQFTEQIYRTLKLACYRASVDMARELGPFPVWDHDCEKDNPFLLRIKDEDPQLWEDMKRYGRRNIALLTTAPAGSVSIVAGPRPYFQTTSGIEPLFRMSYKRRRKINPTDSAARVDFIDPKGDCWEEYLVHHPKLKLWMEVTGETDINKSPYAGCCAEDLDWRQRVKLQAAAGRHVDHSISSTINIPNSATVEDVMTIYETAWREGLKGITVYRDGCRTGVLVDAQTKKTEQIQKTNAPRRPRELPCETYNARVGGKDYFVLVGLLQGDPYEVFVGPNSGPGPRVPPRAQGTLRKRKRGVYDLHLAGEVVLADVAQVCGEHIEAVTRLTSTALRHGADIAFVVHQLEKARGDMQSFSKALARVLKKYIQDGTRVSGEECPGCGGGELRRQEGCVTCPSCGWSKCL